MLKSILVVIGCYLLSIALVLASDPLLTLLFPGDFVRGRIPSNSALAASTAFFIVISFFCAWLCARFAGGARPVLWFFILGEAMGLAATIPNWSKGWPHWHWLSWLIAWPICCWIGALLTKRRPPRITAANG